MNTNTNTNATVTVKCIGVAPFTLKGVKKDGGEKGEKTNEIQNWGVIVFLSNKTSLTAAEYIMGAHPGDAEMGKCADSWKTREYAVHYAGVLADKICEGRVTRKVEDELAEADVKVRNAENAAKATKAWNKAHRDEHTLDGLAKKARAAVKGAVSQTAKNFAQGVADKADKFLAILRNETIVAAEKTNLDDALGFLNQLKAEKAAAVA